MESLVQNVTLGIIGIFVIWALWETAWDIIDAPLVDEDDRATTQQALPPLTFHLGPNGGPVEDECVTCNCSAYDPCGLSTCIHCNV